MGIFTDPGIHKLRGGWLYDCKPIEIKKSILVDGIDRYHMAKTVGHAAERNMQPERLVMMTQRTRKECAALLEKIHAAQPEIKETFHRDIIRAIDDPGHCLIAPNGRRRDFFDRIDKNTYNEAISQLPQTIVSDQTKFEGIGKTWKDGSTYSYAHLLVEAHDGILAEVKRGREEEFYTLYKNNIESEPIDFRTCTLRRDYQLTIPCEVSVGENWYEMEEVKV